MSKAEVKKITYNFTLPTYHLAYYLNRQPRDCIKSQKLCPSSCQPSSQQRPCCL